MLTDLARGGIEVYILNLCRNEWFTRIWTAQEYILASAPIIMCGYSRLHFNDFYHLAILFR